MKKRKHSDQILAQNRHKRWLRSFKKGHRYALSAIHTEWAFVTKFRRIFKVGLTWIEFPNQVDIFGNPAEWFHLFEKLSFPKGAQILLNMRNLEFCYPEGVVYLAAIADHLLNRSNVSIKENQPSLQITDEYLKVCGLRNFFNARKGEAPAIDPKLFGDGIPISRDSQEKTSLAEKMVQLIQSRVSMTQGVATLLSESLGEVMGNSIEHGEVIQWYRIAQIHPTRGYITIAIADNGVGIPHTLRNGHQSEKFKKMKDFEVIRESFESDVTRHAPKLGEAHGAGLNIVLDFVQTTGAKLAMLSGRGMWQLDYTTPKATEKYFDFEKALPGTLLVLRIPCKPGNN